MLPRTIVFGTLLCLFSSLLPSSCSQESARREGAVKHAAPHDSHERSDASSLVRITPAAANKRTVLTVVLSGSASGVRWLVNGAEWPGAEQRTFLPSDCSRGDRVQAKVVIDGREVLSNIVTIANTPPEIRSARLAPEIFRPGDSLGVDVVTFDADHDPVTLIYEWKKNGAPVGEGARLQEPLRRGDVFRVTVTPFDGMEQGAPVIIEREIRNQPPVIEQHADYQFKDPLYTYQVKASDPDDDVLAYSLGTAVPGMTIDSTTGLLTWTVPKEFKGTQAVEVVVTDGNGGTTRYLLQITLN